MSLERALVHVPGGGEIPPVEEVGGKAHNLARLQALGAPVPRWVVLATHAFQPDAADVPEALRAEVLQALEMAGIRDALLAVRSSAAGEDAANASFAGQFDSVLGVRAGPDGAPLWEAIGRVWRSTGNAHALAYARRREGAGPPQLRMAVILQEMVDAAASGVAFSVDPVAGDPETAVISAVFGLGEGLVSGELDADTYHVSVAGSRHGVVRRETAIKELALCLAPAGGTRRIKVPPDLHTEPVLSEAEAVRIGEVVCGLAEKLGGPQDVEWALADDGGAERRLLILQARPITTLGEAATRPSVAKGELRVWDNSNIVESYGGVTTPLTFSFARDVYEEVYLQFCRVMGVGEPLLVRYRHVFANMLGLVRGRVYYNLLNWYRALALLPGYSFNRAFMERMMGVRQKLENPPEAPYVAGRWEDLGRLLRMAAILIREDLRLGGEVKAFYRQVDSVLAPLSREDLGGWSLDRLSALYRRLEDELLRQWRAPLMNDFLAMIYFGVLGRLVEKWLPGSPPTLMNDLLCGEGGIISTEPARRVMALAGQVVASRELSELFAGEPDDRALWERTREEPRFSVFRQHLDAYIERFGDRCMNELKLETVTLRDDPAFLVGMIRAYAAGGHTDPEVARQREREVRHAAEARVHAALSGPRLPVFHWVLRKTRARVRDRENLRFERTRVFGVVRRLFLAAGARLAEQGRLAEPRDVFYLTKEEVFAAADGTGVTLDLRALTALRRSEWQGFEREPAPPDRLETTGPPDYQPVAVPHFVAAVGDELRGTGCCPGVVRAPVRVVRDPRQAGDLSGRILVAERTDPGWTLLFPAAKGLLVQRGSLLSHSAIVAREMGLPCVVAVPHLMETLQDGEWVEMDGTTGVIRRLGGNPG